MKYLDLLGKKWDEMNCGDVVVEGLHRYGLHAAALWVPVDQEAAARVVRLMGKAGRGVGNWFQVATPDMRHYAEEGDVLVADGPGDPEGVYHVSLVVSDGMALTSSRRHGVHCVPVQRTSGLTGIYRWAPEGRS